jgi:hypothetical protein
VMKPPFPDKHWHSGPRSEQRFGRGPRSRRHRNPACPSAAKH